MGASKFSKFVNSPIFWGIGLTGIFYSLLLTRILQVEAISHYFISAKGEVLFIPFVEILMFFIGFSALAFKLTEIRFQMGWIAKQEASSETFFPKPGSGFSRRKMRVRWLRN